MSNKIRLALDIISNHEFICWVEKIGLLDEFNRLEKFVVETIMNRYEKLFEATDGKLRFDEDKYNSIRKRNCIK